VALKHAESESPILVPTQAMTALPEAKSDYDDDAQLTQRRNFQNARRAAQQYRQADEEAQSAVEQGTKQRTTSNLGNIRISRASNPLGHRPITRCQQSFRRQAGTPGGNVRRRERRLEPFRLTSTCPLRTRPLGTDRLTCSPPTYLGRQVKRRRSRS